MPAYDKKILKNYDGDDVNNICEVGSTMQVLFDRHG